MRARAGPTLPHRNLVEDGGGVNRPAGGADDATRHEPIRHRRRGISKLTSGNW